MDFKNIIEKINLIEGIETKKIDLVVDIHGKTDIPEEDKKTIVLDESETIKFLAGTTTLTEAAELMEKKLTKAEKEKKEEVVKSMKKDKKGFEERYGERGEEVMHATATKMAKKKAESQETDSGSLAEAGLDMNLIKAAQGGMNSVKKDPESERNINKPYGSRSDKATDDESDDDEPKAKKRRAKKESIDPEQFRSKFLSLVEAKKKEAEMKSVKGKKAEEKMDESKKKKPDADGDGVPDWADKNPGEDDNAEKKKSANKGLSAKQKKLPPGLQKAIAAKKGKKQVKESLDEFFFPDDSEGGSDGEEKSGKDKIVNVQGEDFILRDTPEGMLLIGDDIEGSWYSSQDGGERTGTISFVVNLTKGKIVEFPDDFNIDYGYLNDEDVEDYIKMVAREVDMKQAKGESSDLDELFYFDGPDSKEKDRGEDELARREKGGHKATDPSYKQKDDPRYGGRYKIGGPKGKLPESQRRYKKVVAESRETKLSFRDMIKLVHESGGQQQIDPLDKNLFAWATRVAKNKFEESTKAEVYAGLVYERMGGRFEMYDVLSESQKKNK